MATNNLNTNLGHLRVIDKRNVPISPASPISAATAVAAQSTATLDVALAAQNGTYWTQARLDATCQTDKLHAYRVASSDGAGIS
jgi:hypothetical protein